MSWPRLTSFVTMRASALARDWLCLLGPVVSESLQLCADGRSYEQTGIRVVRFT
ncbi:hypothetical protein [Mycobacteroides abscessus]|uniref:hypothetical protein n=1 Tax=Mycobacteroides abscessus TaxID=36809 RepID=UPI001603CF3A|nr:hypothetical protein [Mycobacteroides abscessus]